MKPPNVFYVYAFSRIINLDKDHYACALGADELDVLAMLIERYEAEHYPIAPPHPIEAIKFGMDQLGLKPSDLGRVLGYRSRASEIMRGKRKLTLGMIRTLYEKLNIPVESLVARY